MAIEKYFEFDPVGSFLRQPAGEMVGFALSFIRPGKTTFLTSALENNSATYGPRQRLPHVCTLHQPLFHCSCLVASRYLQLEIELRQCFSYLLFY